MTQMLIIPGHHRQDIADFPAASQIYSMIRDGSGEGGSTFPEGEVVVDGCRVARISYNGRVWQLDPAKPDGGGTLVYCPASVGEDEGRPDIFNEGRESVWGRPCENPYPTGSIERVVFQRGAHFARDCYA